MKFEVIQSDWYTPLVPVTMGSALAGMNNLCIGVVAYWSHGHDIWKVKIGYGLGHDNRIDEQLIINRGQNIGSKKVAMAYFPHLDPDKFKAS
jgi:hypothetical protein